MKSLYQPVSVGPLVVKNRFVRSATNDNLGNEDGSISDAEIALYQNLAINDVGLIITAHAYVSSPLGKVSARQNALYDNRFIDGYSKLRSAVKPYGSKLVIQISHAGRQTTPEMTGGLAPKAPSSVIDNSTGITPEAWTSDEIHQLVDDFVKAVERVKRAGADGVQLHIAHGYALSQFISPYTNRRTDEWGGSFENRTRVLREIMTRSRQIVGDYYPIFAKLNSTDGLEGPEYLTLTDVCATASMLAKYGLDALEISGGIRETKGVMARPGITKPEQEAYFLQAAREIRRHVSIPLILVGGLRSVPIMESILAEGTIDLFAMSRPFVVDPSLVVRLQNGAVKASCVSCNACFNPNGLKCYYQGGIEL
jgi:2,4-dienoyl-CoA reductase-like NADH-dependent reductase (Old Yellow Enzyme family)